MYYRAVYGARRTWSRRYIISNYALRPSNFNAAKVNLFFYKLYVNTINLPFLSFPILDFVSSESRLIILLNNT